MRWINHDYQQKAFIIKISMILEARVDNLTNFPFSNIIPYATKAWEWHTWPASRAESMPQLFLWQSILQVTIHAFVKILQSLHKRKPGL